MRSLSLWSAAVRSSFLVAFTGVALAGCGDSSDSMEFTPDDVDESTPVAITEEEEAAFSAPRDGRLTEEQVNRYLKTSLLQFDLVRKHSEGIHARLGEMEKRGEKGGVIAGFRNMVDAGTTMMQVGDLIGGSYIHSARTLGYNPAEMEWVREQFAEAGTYLAMKPMHEAAAQGAKEVKAQAEQFRQQLAEGGPEALGGFSEADIQEMVKNAEEMEAEMAGNDVSPSVKANIEVLHRARPAVTDAMWGTIAITGGSMGLVALSGLADPNDVEAQKKLDEYRTLFEDALANRVTPGMEGNSVQAR